MTSSRNRKGDWRRLGVASRILLRTPPDFSLRETVLSHGWFELAPFHWDGVAGTLTRIEQLPDGSLFRIRMRQPGGRGTEIRLGVAPGNPDGPRRGEIVSRLRRALALDLDLSEFHAFCRKEPRLWYVPRVGAGRFLSAGNIYEDVFKTICGTNIAWKQAVAAVNRIATLGKPLRGTCERAFPTPRRILRLGESRLADLSRLGYRVPYLTAWARRAESPEATYLAAEAGRLSLDEIRRFFLSVRGVGETATRYLLLMRGHGGEIPIDSSVTLYCRVNRFGGRTPTDDQIRSLYEPYGRWKGLGYWFEFLPWARRHWRLDGSSGQAAGMAKRPRRKVEGGAGRGPA